MYESLDQSAAATGDRILAVQILATAIRHARFEPLPPDEEAAAVAELQQLADGRAGLLARVAGLCLGFSPAGLPGEADRNAGALCITAGADPALIPYWTRIGEARARTARMPVPQLGHAPARSYRLTAAGPPA